MAAIQLQWARAQISRLLKEADDPRRLYHDLTELFEQCANWSYRPSEGVPPRTRLASYHLAAALLDELEIDLRPLAASSGEAALLLVDLLWQSPYLEPRILAADLLGALPLDFEPEVVRRLHDWARPSEDREAVEVLLRRGTARIVEGDPGDWLERVSAALESKDAARQSLALRGLVPLVRSSHNELLPRVFNLLTGLVRRPAPVLAKEIQLVLRELATVTPTETAVFLRQQLLLSNDLLLRRLVRPLLPLFGEPLRSDLRELTLPANSAANQPLSSGQ